MKLSKFKWLGLSQIVLFLVFLTNCKPASEKNNQIQTNNNEVMKNSKEIIVDVRTPEEWEMDGHAECSVNYPLDQIQNKIEDLKKYDHVILVCRSGNRAGIAQQILMQAGIKNIENKGPWQNAVCNN